MKVPDSRSTPAPLPSGRAKTTPDYIADMCEGLIRLAEKGHHDMLAYLLGMAQLEAESLGRGLTGRDRPDEETTRE